MIPLPKRDLRETNIASVNKKIDITPVLALISPDQSHPKLENYKMIKEKKAGFLIISIVGICHFYYRIKNECIYLIFFPCQDDRNTYKISFNKFKEQIFKIEYPIK